MGPATCVGDCYQSTNYQELVDTVVVDIIRHNGGCEGGVDAGTVNTEGEGGSDAGTVNTGNTETDTNTPSASNTKSGSSTAKTKTCGTTPVTCGSGWVSKAADTLCSTCANLECCRRLGSDSTTSDGSSTTSTTSTTPSFGDDDNTGVIVGVVVGALLCVCIAVAAAAVYVVTASRTKKKQDGQTTTTEKNSIELSNIEIKDEQVSNPLGEQKDTTTTKTSSAGWAAHMDDSSGSMYYANEITGETTWAKPPSLQLF